MLEQPLDEGTELNLQVDVPGDNVPIFASCQVAWQKDVSNTDGSRAFFETGVRFTNINSLDKGRLLEYIYSQWLRLLDKNGNVNV